MSSTKEDITMIELPPSETLDKLLTVAIDASRQAGDIILGNAGGADVLKSKANSRDLLTLIDPLCEKVERNIIISGFAFIIYTVLNSHAYYILYVHNNNRPSEKPS
jgi:myo-inositol-1(or 4)-monophosphatase